MQRNHDQSAWLFWLLEADVFESSYKRFETLSNMALLRLDFVSRVAILVTHSAELHFTPVCGEAHVAYEGMCQPFLCTTRRGKYSVLPCLLVLVVSGSEIRLNNNLLKPRSLSFPRFHSTVPG